jgi:hypothetical protein
VSLARRPNGRFLLCHRNILSQVGSLGSHLKQVCTAGSFGGLTTADEKYPEPAHAGS